MGHWKGRGLGRRGQGAPIILILILVVGIMVAGVAGLYIRQMAEENLTKVDSSQKDLTKVMETKLDILAAFSSLETTGERANSFCDTEECDPDRATTRVVLIVKNTGKHMVSPSFFDKVKVFMNDVPLENHTQYRLDYTRGLYRDSIMHIPLNITCSDIGERKGAMAEFKIMPPKGDVGLMIVNCATCCGEFQKCHTAC